MMKCSNGVNNSPSSCPPRPPTIFRAAHVLDSHIVDSCAIYYPHQTLLPQEIHWWKLTVKTHRKHCCDETPRRSKSALQSCLLLSRTVFYKVHVRGIMESAAAYDASPTKQLTPHVIHRIACCIATCRSESKTRSSARTCRRKANNGRVPQLEPTDT